MEQLLLVSILVIIATYIVLSFYYKKRNLKRKGIKYRIIEIIGIFIPFLFILAYYAYMHTDTVEEAKIVTAGIYASFVLVILYFELWIKSKYNYIILPIIILTIFCIGDIINYYMLTGIEKKHIFGFVFSIWLAALSSSKDKIRIIITGIISLIIVLTVDYSTSYKVERVAMEYAKEIGCDITEKDNIGVIRGSTRGEKISLYVIGEKSDEDLRLRMTYFEGEIIECTELKVDDLF